MENKEKERCGGTALEIIGETQVEPKTQDD